MNQITTARGTEFRVSQTTAQHRDALGPITLSVDTVAGSPFRMQDYLTVEEAFNLAANLTAQAMKVERENGVEQDVPF